MRIFTTQEFVEGRIPQITPYNDFNTALKIYNEEFVDKHLDNGIITAFPYGSLLIDPKPTSDADYLLVFDNMNLEDESSQIAARIFRQHNVPFQFNVLSRENAEAGIHTINPGFRQHLEHCVRKYGYKGKHPFEVIAPCSDSFEDSLFESIAAYDKKNSTRFQESFYSEIHRLNYLESALSSPFHVMRIMIQQLQGNLGDDYDDTKSYIVTKYSELYGNFDFLDDLEAVTSAIDFYQDLVSSRGVRYAERDREQLEKIYSHGLNDLNFAAACGKRFVRNNVEIMRESRK